MAGIKCFQAIVASVKARDIGAADTVAIGTDMLAELTGFDKHAEITSEYASNGTYCDPAIKNEGVIHSMLVTKGHVLHSGLVPLAEVHVQNAAGEFTGKLASSVVEYAGKGGCFVVTRTGSRCAPRLSAA